MTKWLELDQAETRNLALRLGLMDTISLTALTTFCYISRCICREWDGKWGIKGSNWHSYGMPHHSWYLNLPPQLHNAGPVLHILQA